MEAGKKEIHNLTQPKAINRNLPPKKSVLKDLARVSGENYVELLAKVVFTIKPHKFKIRIIACGNQMDAAFGKITTTDLDSCMLRFLLSWGASTRKNHSHFGCDSSLPPRRLAPRTNCRSEASRNPLQVGSHPYRVCVESPSCILWTKRGSLWSQEGTAVMEKMKLWCLWDKSFKVVISETYRSICLLAREKGCFEGSVNAFDRSN